MIYCKNCKFNKPNPEDRIKTYCTLKEANVLKLGLCTEYARPIVKELVNV